jgi:hypothetical protein
LSAPEVRSSRVAVSSWKLWSVPWADDVAARRLVAERRSLAGVQPTLTLVQEFSMRAVISLSLIVAAAGLAACGQTIEQRAATGAIAGAVVAGPVGAAVGGAAGTAVGQAAKDD